MFLCCLCMGLYLATGLHATLFNFISIVTYVCISGPAIRPLNCLLRSFVCVSHEPLRVVPTFHSSLPTSGYLGKATLQLWWSYVLLVLQDRLALRMCVWAAAVAPQEWLTGRIARASVSRICPSSGRISTSVSTTSTVRKSRPYTKVPLRVLCDVRLTQ
jgi:hypothetical protein